MIGIENWCENAICYETVKYPGSINFLNTRFDKECYLHFPPLNSRSHSHPPDAISSEEWHQNVVLPIQRIIDEANAKRSKLKAALIRDPYLSLHEPNDNGCCIGKMDLTPVLAEMDWIERIMKQHQDLHSESITEDIIHAMKDLTEELASKYPDISFVFDCKLRCMVDEDEVMSLHDRYVINYIFKGH